jgi:release factor glutamine methyltransferase
VDIANLRDAISIAGGPTIYAAPTVAVLLADSIVRLTAVGIDSPRLDAQLLLVWALDCRREDLAREPERIVSEDHARAFREAVALRAARRPLPYITGEQYFHGRPFTVDETVLIPRPETELLVAAVCERAGDIARPKIADIGTGSGCIAVTLALELPVAEITATDISGSALAIAGRNAARHGVDGRLALLQGDLLHPLPGGVQWDIIVSNPPYIAEKELAALQPEVRDHEPRIALAGEPDATGPDGTGLYRRLLAEAPRRLVSGGWLLVEVGLGQADTVGAMARSAGCREVTVANDYAGIARVVGMRW